MRNHPAGYKHSDPTHLQFGQSADSALLAKRKRFAEGGAVDEIAARNAPYVKGTPSTYTTTHTPAEEQLYQAWVDKNKVPTAGNDYDMRGFYRGLLSGDPVAASAIDPNDQRMHYPDKWKTPAHETFSRESQWATPNAPAWNEKDQLVSSGGRVLFDDRARALPIGDPNREP
jgi:hypothetical protein